MSSDPLPQLKQALATIKELRERLTTSEEKRAEPIAILGMGCRFPGDANTPAEFWRLLATGRDAVGSVPADRWDADEFFDSDGNTPGKINTREGGFLSSLDGFDADFFGISPREAERMDPQQRLLLEVAWEALEASGQTAEKLDGSATGVFVGVHSHSNDYYLMQVSTSQELNPYTGTGTAHNVISGRLSYTFNLHGPSVVVDTACSSSLVAAHLAVQALRAGECDLAIVGGVNVLIAPWFYIAAAKMQMLAPDGRCKPFSAAADGFGRGEGCGVVVLKRLSDAQADRDPILALIRGSAINQDGRTNGLVAPNGLAQEAVVRMALANAGVKPQQIGLVETHGTGTRLGDPIEVDALSKVFASRPDGLPCYLGSVKSNIAHLEGGAGVAGIIKSVLSLQHRQVPPLVHFDQLNPHITLTGTPFVIPTTLLDWESAVGPRFAGVSSFGWSGTNAHLILEEAPLVEQPSATDQGSRPILLPLSARSPAALAALAETYRAYLSDPQPAFRLRDVGYSSSMRRSLHDFRFAVAGRTADELAGKIADFLAARGSSGSATSEGEAGGTPRLVFVFPGQGSQWNGMANQLYAREPVFREMIERCQNAFRAYVDWSLVDLLAHSGEQPLPEEIDVIQPVLFAVQVALAAVWEGWGIHPGAVVGHSMGEVAAAAVSGALSLEDAAQVICQRSLLLRQISGQGVMAVVSLSMGQAREELKGLEDRVAIAVSNSPKSSVLSGEPAAVELILERLRARNIFCRMVKVDVASHSPQVEPLQPELTRRLSRLQPRSTRVHFYSTVWGEVTPGEALDAGYWSQNLRQPVIFSRVIDTLASAGQTVYIEISPHPILLGPIDECYHARKKTAACIPSITRGCDEQAALCDALARLYDLGFEVDWRAFYPDGGRFVELPGYPWQKTRYWLQTARPSAALDVQRTDLVLAGPTLPLLGQALPAAADAPGKTIWQSRLGEEVRHRLSQPARSGAGEEALYAEWVSAALQQLAPGCATSLSQLAIPAPFTREDCADQPAQLILQQGEAGSFSFRLFSQAGSGATPIGPDWSLRASGEGKSFPVHQADFYDLVWKEKALLSGKVCSSPTPVGIWLIVADRAGIGQALQKRIKAAGDEVSLLAYKDPAQFRSGLAELRKATAQPPRGVIYLRGSDTPQATDLDGLEAAQHVCGTDALDFIQALREQALDKKMPIWLVTRGAQPLEGTVPALGQALLWGLARVAALELPEMWGGVVDLAPDVAPSQAAERLFAEITGPDGEDQVAYRGERRFVPRLVSAETQTPTLRPMRVRADATYLVTGGLGSLGLEIAAWLVEQGARRLVLTSRRGLPARSEWAQAAAAGPRAEQIAAVRRLEELGAQVWCPSADAADPEQMARVWEELQRSWPPVRGMVHAAGVASVATLDTLTGNAFTDVLRPKVRGGWICHELSQTVAAQQPLDFFILFSSGASVWGSQGLAHYAAANQFLDALAHYRTAMGLPATCVNWGWWEGDGMATDALKQFFQQIGMTTFTKPEGLSAMAFAVGTGSAQKVFTRIDWQAFKPIYEAKRMRPLLELVGGEPTRPAVQTGETQASGVLAELEALPPSKRLTFLIRHVRRVAAGVLAVEPADQLDIHKGFFKLGMDSMMTVQLRAQLVKSLDCALPPTIAFEYPTVEQLVKYLASETLASLFQTEPERHTAPGVEAEQAALDGLSEAELVQKLDDQLAHFEKYLQED